MPPRYARHEDKVLHCPYTVEQYRSLWERFNALPDVRRTKGRRHRLASTLTICALATLCGARGTRAIADFAGYLTRTQLRLLRAYRNPRTGEYEPPSEPTIRRILKRVPAAAFDAAVMEWMRQNDPHALRRVAVDGKTVKGSRRADGRPVHLVSAVSPDSLRLVAQRPVEEKSNEITALRPMLAEVPLDGVVVTADAMHAQQEAARLIQQEKGGDYFFTLKGNQPSIQERAQRLLAGAFPPTHPPQARTEEQGHGRLERRELWALSVTPEQIGLYGAAQVVRIRRRFLHLNNAQASDQTVWAITSLEALPDATANGEFLLEIARGQWSIENGHHYVRDRSYDEDRCQVREPNSAQILATLRSLARFLAKQGAHRPRSAHQQTTPALHRFCNAHRNQAIHWLLSPRGFR